MLRVLDKLSKADGGRFALMLWRIWYVRNQWVQKIWHDIAGSVAFLRSYEEVLNTSQQREHPSQDNGKSPMANVEADVPNMKAGRGRFVAG